MTRLASLQNRIFFASAALALITIALAVYLVQLRLTRETETEIERSLMQARRLVEQQHQTLSSQFLLVARLVADLPVLKAAVETQDPATVAPIAREYERTLGADLFRLTGRDGRQLFVTADSPVPGAGADEAPPPVEETAAFWRHPRGILQVVTVPIVIGRQSPDLLGTLTAGFLLDAHRADQIKAATASDIGFALDGELLASTVRPAAAPRLEQVTSASGVTRLRLGGEDWVATGVPLVLPLAPAGTAPASQPVVVVLRSRTVELRALRSINAALLTAGAIAVGLAIVLSYAVARSVTRPLGAITGTMREMSATGDLARKIELRGPEWWQDEDARLLASTFNSLAESLARFQRETAERDRLAALGRLSTVIAHEVRNPLMIIKASLRSLRPGATNETLRDAAADIGEQVTRLNHVVHDVLDFARPQKLALVDADLAEVCRDAANTSEAGQPGPRIRVAAPHLVVTTDPERLRAALVNVLNNARHAVTERAGGDKADLDPVTLCAEHDGAAGRVRIHVRDRGTGVDPADLPHVFEPYFTTRRGGTGLGLPIARNIIESLGGRITMRPEPIGTTVCIELPAGTGAPETTTT
jgi:signal transduction histidine kinase